MTADPFKNHFKMRALLRISMDLINCKKRDTEDSKTLVHVEGRVLKITRGIFQEVLVQDTYSAIIIPIITFEPIDSCSNLMCVGVIHYGWSPDLRCPDIIYHVAIKASIIKQR